ncbi:MAG: glycosyltransferase family 4 protein [Ilumatobacteraceae bacterium]
MKIIVLTPFYPPVVSGAGRYLADVCEGLVAAGHEVTVLMAQGEAATEVRNGVTVKTVRSRVRGGTSALMAVCALGLHIRRRADLVIAGTAYPGGVVGALVARIIRLPLVVIAYGEDVSVGRTSRLARRCLPFVFRTARRTIAISEFTRREVIAQGGPADRCSVLAPGIDVAPFIVTGAAQRDAFRERFGLRNQRVVLTVARLDERKGHDIVLAAIHQLMPEFANLHYVVVGSGDTARLRGMAAGLGLSDRLTIIDYLGDDELPDAYAAADLFAMVSRPGPRGDVEGFGIVYLEAAASGLACVAGELGGCGDAVVHGLTGLCVDPLDPTVVAGAMRQMLIAPELARKMGSEGKRRVQEGYQRSSMQHEMTELVDAAGAAAA